MAFRNPEVLYALLALLVPLIIHLFNFRRYTTIYFSSVERLLSIQKDTRSRSKLKNLLILLSRLLLFAAIIIVFAGPFKPTADFDSNQKEKIIGICLDNSFSMQAGNDQGVLLDQAINAIQLILNDLPDGQKLIFFTNDPNSAQSRIISRDQLFKMLGQTGYSARKFDPLRVIDQFNRQISSLPSSYNLQRELWLFSDFQKNSFNPEEFQSDSSLLWQFFPISPSVTDNLSVDSCWFDQLGHLPNEPEILKVSISNHSGNPVSEIPLRLYIDDSLRAVSTVSINGKEQITAELNYQIDNQSFIRARIELDDYPVSFDNSLYYSYLHNQKIKVIDLAQQENSLWKNAFGVESFFDYQFMPVNAINYNELEQADMIILNALPVISSGLLSKIEEFTENGTSIMLIPDLQSSPLSWNSFLEKAELPLFANLSKNKSEISVKSFDHPYLKKSILSKQDNPRLPYFQEYFEILPASGKSYSRILFNEQNHIFSYSAPFINGQILVFASQLTSNKTNLIDHPLFLPLIYNFAFASIGHQDLYKLIGLENSIALPLLAKEFNTLQVTDSEGNQTFTPAITRQSGRLRLQVGSLLNKSGNYLITADETKLAVSSWNYGRIESVLDFYAPQELENLIQKENQKMMKVIDLNSGSAFSEVITQSGIDLSRWFIFAALLFLLMELLLVRRSMNRDS